MTAVLASLVAHPLGPSLGPDVGVRASSTWADDGSGTCRFELTGDLASIRIPPPAPRPARLDDLWRHTCFEAFVAAASEPAYREFNFSPSGDWAAYRFRSYRTPDAPAEIDAPSIGVTVGPERLVVTVRLAPGAGPVGAPEVEVGLSAVIETHVGALGYFALHHPADRPDFHDRRGFRLQLRRSNGSR